MNTQWLVAVWCVCLGCSAEAISCNDDEVFCMATGQCIHKDTECGEVVHSCQPDEAFCLQSGKCVKIEGSCSGNNGEHHCNDRDVFCLQQGECTPVETPDCTDEKEICLDGKIRCLQTGDCIEVDRLDCEGNTHETIRTCQVNQVFCLETEQCIEEENSCKPFTDDEWEMSCPEHQVKCIQTGNCIDKDWNCFEDSDPFSCSHDGVFCLQTGHCVDKDNPCHQDSISGDVCPYGQIKCLQTGQCIDKDSNCNDEKQICHPDLVMCLQTGTCVEMANSCEDTKLDNFSINCPPESVMCLQTGHCVSPSHTCVDKNDKTPTNGCPSGQVLCLQTGKCIPVSETCEGADESPPRQCPPDKLMCLQTGECRPVAGFCSDPDSPQSDTGTCPPGKMMCLQAGMCVSKKDSCENEDTDDSLTRQCPHGQVFCLHTGECTPAAGICKDEDDSLVQQCPPGKVMCLQTGQCIRATEFCDDKDDYVAQQCSPSQVMCLQTGECVPKNDICDERDEEDDDSESYQCQQEQIMCLQTGKCIPNNNPCDDNGTDNSSTYQCPPGEIMCLQTGECIHTTKLCEEKDTDDSHTHQCLPGTVMCLQTGECVPRTNNCDGEDRDDSKYNTCPVGRVMCLQSGECKSLPAICDDDDDDSSTDRCPHGQPMCLQTGKCLPLGRLCEGNETDDLLTKGCSPGKVMCLQTGKCISAETICDAVDTEGQQCLPGQVMCLQTGECTSATRNCDVNDNDVLQCSSDEIMCLQSGECIGMARLCNGRATNDTSISDNVTFTSTDSYSRNTTIHRVTLNMTYEEFTTTESNLYNETSTVTDTSTIHITDSTTTQTTHEVHLLLHEPLFLQEDYQFTLNEILSDYNTSEELQISCNANVKVKSTSGLIITNMNMNLTDTLVVTVTSGVDGECRIISKNMPFGVYVLHIKTILDQISPTVTFIQDIEEIEEDTMYIYFESWTYWYNITLNAPHLDLSSFNLSNEERLDVEKKYKDKLIQKHYKTGIKAELKLEQVPYNSFGVPVAILEKHNGIKWIPQTAYTIVDIIKDRYRIRFTETCNCHFTLELRQRGLITNQDSITIQVIAMNDSPELTNKAILRYSQTVESYILYPYVHANTEFKIEDFIHHFFYDEDDNDVLGLAVIGQISETIGVWEFHRNNSWHAFPMLDISDMVGGNIENVTLYLFTPNDTLRFLPSNSTYLWTRRQAIAYTKLFVLGWDGYIAGMNDVTDELLLRPCNGIHHKICGPGGSSEYSKDILALYISREGCDGTASSLMSTDLCGVCGGHDDCVDCTDTANGGAVFDMCGECTGGSSGLVYGQSLDCNNECGTSYYEQRLQMCIRNGTDIDGLLALLSCDSVLNSGAYVNKCEHCVQGTTGFSDTHGEDTCGICDGDGTSCVDCNNVIDGDSVLDLCGACLDPSDSNFNKGCQRLGSVTPPHVRDYGQHTIHVFGVNLHVFTFAECTLEGEKTISFNETMFNISKSELDLLTPVFSGNVRGVYNISCVFDGNTTLLLENSIVIFQYLEFTDISPGWMNIGQHTKVNITTSKMENTGFIQCVLICPFTRPDIGCYSSSTISSLVIPTVVIDSTTVQCDLQKMADFRHARGYNISIILEPRNVTDIARLTSLEFIIRAEAPVLQSVTFDRSFCYFHVLFNTEVTGPRMCRDIFQIATLDLLGTDPFCIIVGKRILVDLGDDYTLRPDDSINLKSDSIYRFNAMPQYADFTSGSVNINGAHDAMQPEFSLSGPNSVGNCEEFSLVLIQKNGGCMKFRYKWTINETSGSNWMNTTGFTAFKNRIESNYHNMRMMKVFKTEIPAGEDAQFMVSIEDDLNNNSHTVKHTVIRDATLNPVSITLKLLGKRQSVDPARIVRFYAKAKVVECYNASQENIKFSWQSGSTDFSLSLFNDKPIAAIRPNTLRGGTSYTVTITAFLEDDSTAVTEETITFHTKSKPLIVYIDGGDYMMFSSKQEILLNAGVSRDPDRRNLQAFYSWTCRYENGFPCLSKQGNETVLMSTVFPSYDRVVIPANSLSTGDRLIWTVTMNVGNRFGSFTTTVDIVNILPPIIELQETAIKINHNEKLRIPCTVTSYGPVMMTWSNSFKIGYDTIDLSTFLPEKSLMQETSEAVSNWDFSLYIDLSDDNSLPAGANFVFTVSVFALDTEQGREQHVFVTVNTPPTTGDVTVTPTNGISLTTVFTIDIGNGWTDVDGDNTVLYFYVKKAGQDWMKLNARGLSDVYSYDFKLTEGTYDVMVEICDTYEACSDVKITSTVVVADKVFTKAELDQEAASITRVLKADINQAIGMALALSSLLVSKHLQNTGLVSVVVNDVTENLLTSVVASIDRVDATSVLDSSNAMLRKLSNVGMMSSTVRSESQSLAFELASFVTQGSSRRRRKRSTTVTVTPLSISDAEVILTTYSATFATQSENSTTSSSASQFLEALDNIFIGICATVSYTEDPIVIYSDLATVNIDKRVVENTALNVYDISCRNCSSYISYPAEVVYEHSIQSKYTHWNCSTYLSCYGACFTSAQITKDLVTPTSPSEMSLTDRVRRSDIIVLKVVNPYDYTIVTVGSLLEPIMLSMSIHGDVNSTLYSLQCLHWSQDTWNDTTCSASTPFISDSVYMINCSCMTLGYFAVFEGPVTIDSDETSAQPEDTNVAMETSTMHMKTSTVHMETSTVHIKTTTNNVDHSTGTEETPTEMSQTISTETDLIDTSTKTMTISTEAIHTSTDAMETSTQGTTVMVTMVSIPTSADSVDVSFTIDAVYSVVIGSDKEDFISRIKQTIANTMGINSNRIVDMNVLAGSIIVTFTVEIGDTSEPSIESAIQTLYNSIKSDTLIITDTNGTPLSIIKSSFSYEVAEKDEEEPKTPTTLFVIFGCLGTLLAVAAVIVAVLLHKMKVMQRNVVNSPPPPYGPQMHGVDVPIPANNCARQFVVRERTLSNSTPISKQTVLASQKDGKSNVGAGNGSSIHDVDFAALEKGTGSTMEGKGGCYSGRQSTTLQNNWMESETVKNPRIGSAHSIPGPADYMPPITG